VAAAGRLTTLPFDILAVCLQVEMDCFPSRLDPATYAEPPALLRNRPPTRALSLNVAAECTKDFPGGVTVAWLASVRSAELVAAEVAVQLELSAWVANRTKTRSPAG
jgi:hypothetical protein